MFYEVIIMRFRIPGTQVTARIFEPVATSDSQYTVVDVGIEHPSGGIDSVVGGWSAFTAKEVIAQMNRKSDDKAAEKVEEAAA